ncbi:MAG: serine/threonine-protein kinase [Bradymonadia bacterium]
MKASVYIGGYQLVEPIAEGGMGTIWKARHPHLDRWVAIKQIRADVRHDDSVQQAFISEVQNLSKLHSPQIVQVLDFGFQESGEPYMVTEFLEGEDLAQRLGREGTVHVGDALAIVIEVLKALAEAHSIGLVHRDLKPGNIFIQRLPGDSQIAVKVLDFGVAKLLDTETMGDLLLPSMGIKGSPHYMAPEQALMQSVTPASDIYSLGAVLYRMLVGRDVFTGTTRELLDHHINSVPRSLKSLLPDLSLIDQVDDIVMLCLEKDPSLRPSSAAALVKRLERLIAAYRREFTDSYAASSVFSLEVGEVTRAREQPHWLQTGAGVASAESELDTSDASPQQGHVVGREISSISSSDFDALRDATRAHLNREHPQSSLRSATEIAPLNLISREMDDFDSSKTVEDDRSAFAELWRDEARKSSSVMEVESGAADEAASLSGVEEDYVDRDPSAPLPPMQSTVASGGAISRNQIMAVVVGIIILVLAGYVLSIQDSDRKPLESIGLEADAGVAELMRKIERTTRRDDIPTQSAPPNIVRQLKLNKNDAIQATDTVRVLVTNGKARFSRAIDGQIICSEHAACDVAITADVRVSRRGYRPQVLKAMDLNDRRGNSWEITLQRR